MKKPRRDKLLRPNGVIYIRGIPRDTKDRFKAYCYARGTDMTKAINDFMEKCVREDTNGSRRLPKPA